MGASMSEESTICAALRLVGVSLMERSRMRENVPPSP